VRITATIISFTVGALLSFACQDNKPRSISTSQSSMSRVIDSIQIFHKTLNVKIPLAGYPEYWKKETLYSQDTCQIISLLVEEGQKVSANELLLSLWELRQSRDFTPVDIRAPFAGSIGKVFVRIGSKLGKEKPLLFIYNDDFLSVKTKMHQDQIQIIKKNQKVISGSAEYNFNGFVQSVDKRNEKVIILLDNNLNHMPLFRILLNVLCDDIKGDFILSERFKNNKLTAYIDEESSFDITAIAVSDSFSLISPGLPHLSWLSVINHNN